MKITKEHYEHIKEEISKLRKEDILSHGNAVLKSGKFKDFDMRMRWDIAHAVNLDQFFCAEIYKYAHDEHIDTALKQACSELQIVFQAK